MKENTKKSLSKEKKIYYIVIAVAANKSDMYEYEEIEEKVGKSFAKVSFY